MFLQRGKLISHCIGAVDTFFLLGCLWNGGGGEGGGVGGGGGGGKSMLYSHAAKSELVGLMYSQLVNAFTACECIVWWVRILVDVVSDLLKTGYVHS